MKLVFKLSSKQFVFLVLSLLVFLTTAFAQTPTGTLRGQVTDPSGAAVANATVVLLPAEGASSTATTSRDGFFEVKPVVPGKYTVQVFAQGFPPFKASDVVIGPGSPPLLNVKFTLH